MPRYACKSFRLRHNEEVLEHARAAAISLPRRDPLQFAA
jgi:hypothetical protein